MGMLRAAIDMELGELLPAERAAGQHPFDRLLDDPLRMAAAERLARRSTLDAAGITGVAVIGFLGALIAGQADLLGVDHHDMIAAIDMGRVHRLMLAAQSV